ncbi:ABC transporter substrate-binding protein [Nonomuraea sp. KM88]|uniref:ABC transporter substrate-binding protein n=1 Tax=Nonomuraea sp. KM88 TaxID=3457427 RepID=UPI003FCDCA47
MTWLGDQLSRIADDMPQRDLAGRAIEAYHRRRRNVIAMAAAAVVVVVVLGGTVAIKLRPEAARPAAPPERAVIDVGVADTVEAAPLHVAMDKGYFAAEGLRVRPVPSHAIAAVSATETGEFDLAQTDYVGSFLARQHDKKVRIVGGLYRARPGSMALVVKAGSRIRSVADLKGRKVAVPHLRGLSSLSVAALLKRSGLTTEDVILVESPYHNGVKGLDAGIAATLLAEPYLTTSVREKAVRVLRPALTGEFEGLPTAGWMAGDDWIQDNPRTLAAFQRALARAHRLIAADPAQAVQALASSTKFSARDLDGLALGSYSAELDVKGLQRLADLARKYSVLEKGLDVRDVIR